MLFCLNRKWKTLNTSDVLKEASGMLNCLKNFVTKAISIILQIDIL